MNYTISRITFDNGGSLFPVKKCKNHSLSGYCSETPGIPLKWIMIWGILYNIEQHTAKADVYVVNFPQYNLLTLFVKCITEI